MTNPNRHLVRIVPAEPNERGYTKTQGTKVLIGDTELPGVYDIALYADVNNVWTATIRCHCQPPEVSVEATVEVAAPLSRWRRWLLRLLGVRAIEVTHLGSFAREWRLP